MAREDARGAELRGPFRRQPASAHEAQALGNMGGELLVAMPRGAVLDEAEIPAMHVVEIGVAALRKRAEQIEGRGRLPISHGHALRVRNSRRFGELDAVDNVAAIAWKLLAVLLLRRCRTGLGELAGDAAEFHDWRAPRIGQHHRHLQKDAEEIAYRISAMLGEALGAIAALQQEGFSGRDARKLRFKVPRLARENERRKTRELPLDFGKLGRIGIDRVLLDRLGAPTVGAPSRRHDISPEKADAI